MPSLHEAVLFACTQLADGVPAFWHVSVVHGLLSPHSALPWHAHTVGPGTH